MLYDVFHGVRIFEKYSLPPHPKKKIIKIVKKFCKLLIVIQKCSFAHFKLKDILFFGHVFQPEYNQQIKLKLSNFYISFGIYIYIFIFKLQILLRTIIQLLNVDKTLLRAYEG